MKAIRIEVMYRDGANYKNSSSFDYENDTELSAKEIKELFRKNDLFEEPIIVQDYGIESIAPLSNEFINPPIGSEDHSYCEIVEITRIVWLDPKASYGKVSNIVRLVKNPEEREKLVQERKNNAIKLLIHNIREIDNGPTEEECEIMFATSLITVNLFEEIKRDVGGDLLAHAKIASLAFEFEQKHKNVNWEEQENDYESALMEFVEELMKTK